MEHKPILAKCDTCKEPKSAAAYRRDATQQRHGTCVACEDAAEAAKVEARRAKDRERKRRAVREAAKVIRTRWIGGTYPGATE